MGVYVALVERTLDTRRAAFGNFVARSLRYAKQNRGWGIGRVAVESGVSENTLARWRDGVWTKFPDPDLIWKFCDALDIPPAQAFELLWPGKTDKPKVAEPMDDPLVEEVGRALNDPSVSAADKQQLRALLEMWRAAAAPRDTRPRKRAS